MASKPTLSQEARLPGLVKTALPRNENRMSTAWSVNSLATYNSKASLGLALNMHVWSCRIDGYSNNVDGCSLWCVCMSPSNDYTAVACNNNNQAQLHNHVSVPY